MDTLLPTILVQFQPKVRRLQRESSSRLTNLRFPKSGRPKMLA